ncbi:hypothetical protein DFQ27_007272, partial [Actinomortierella ambigua]
MSRKPQPGQRRDSHSSEAFEHASWRSSSAPFVRRALASLNSAWPRSSRPVSITTVHLEDNRYGAMPITSLLYPQSHNTSSQHSHPHPHQHQKTTRSGITPAARQALTYSTYSAHSNCTSDSFYSNSSTLTPMTTDDDASSTASHRPRTRLLSPPGSVPSPLSTYNYTGGNHSTGNIHNPHQHPGHERSVSFTSSSAPPPSAPLSGQARLAVIDVNPKTTTIQLKVKHLARSIVHSGYLSKYVPRTFFSRKQWKRRYFILDRRSLHCFKSSDPRHPLLESIELCAEANVYVTDAFPGKRYCIQISCPNERDWYVLADTAPEMSAWLRELKAIVSQFRTGHPGEGGVSGSHFSEDTVSISSASGQDHHLLHPGSTTASDYGRSTPRSGSPLPRPTDPFHPHGQMTSLSPPPRSLTPKPPTPIPASSVRSTTAEREVTHPTRRRNNSNVSSTGHSVNDYISIHSVMAQAEALDLSDTHSVSSHHDHGNHSTRSDQHVGEISLQQLKQQHKQRQQQQQQQQQQLQQQQLQQQQQHQHRQDEQQLEAEDDYTNGHRDFTESTGGYSRPSSPKPATLPRSVRESRISLISNHRMSVVSDRSDSMNAILPRRSSQRMSAAAGPPRPMSPIGSLGRQGTFSGRASPRNSLVVSPPPRSIHRPPSMAIRHSTQIMLPPQIQTDFASHPIMSRPPTQSLPATPDSADSNSTFNGSLSRLTSMRNQRDLALNRQSSFGSMFQGGGGGGGGGVGGSGRQQGVLNTRTSMLSINSSVYSGVTSPALSGMISPPSTGSRPMSPIPSLAEAPTQPLPEPPRDQQQQYVTISRTPSLSSEQNPARRNSAIPRHHQPDMILPPRSRVQSRSPSMERPTPSSATAIVTTVVSQEEVQPARRARSPPPRLSAVLMEGASLPRPKDSTLSTCSSTSTSSTSSGSSNSNNGHNIAGSQEPAAAMMMSPTSPKARASRQMFSLPIRTLQNLPAPPLGQPPSPKGGSN